MAKTPQHHAKEAGGGIAALPLLSRTLHSRVECQPLWHTQVNRPLHLLLERHQLRGSLLDEFGIATVFHPYTGFEVVGTRRVNQITIGERGDGCVEWLQRSCPLWYGEDATGTDDDVVVDEAVAWCCEVLVDISEVVSAWQCKPMVEGLHLLVPSIALSKFLQLCLSKDMLSSRPRDEARHAR